MSNSRPSSSRIMLEQEHLEALLDDTGVDHRASDTQLSKLITSLATLATAESNNDDSSVKVTDQSLFQKTVSEAIRADVDYISFLVNTQTKADSEAAHWISITLIPGINTNKISECIIHDSVEHKNNDTLEFYRSKIDIALQQAGLAQDNIIYKVANNRLQVDEISCGYIAFLNFIANTPENMFQSLPYNSSSISFNTIKTLYTSKLNHQRLITALNDICAPTIRKIQNDISRRKQFRLQQQGRAKTATAPVASPTTTTVVDASTSPATPAAPTTVAGTATPLVTPAESTAASTLTPIATTTVAGTTIPPATPAAPTTVAGTATPPATPAATTTVAGTTTPPVTPAATTTVAGTAKPSATPVIVNPLNVTEATANVARLKVIAATKATEAHEAYLNAEAERQATAAKNRETYEANGNTAPLSDDDIPSQTALEAEEEAAAERAEEAYQAAMKAEDDLKTFFDTSSETTLSSTGAGISDDTTLSTTGSGSTPSGSPNTSSTNLSDSANSSFSSLEKDALKAKIKQWAKKNINDFMNSSESIYAKEDTIYQMENYFEPDIRNINRLINFYQNELNFIEHSNRSNTEVKNQLEAIKAHVALLEKLLYEYKYSIKSLLTHDKRTTLLDKSKEKRFQECANQINETLEKIKAFNEQTTHDAQYFNDEHPDLAYSTKSEAVLDTNPHVNLNDEIAQAVGRAFGNIDSDNIPGLESGVPPTSSGRFTNKSNKVTVFKISVEDKRSKSKFVTATVRETGNDLSFVKSTFHAADEKRSFFTKPWFKDTSFSMIEIAAQNIKNHRVALNDKLAQEPMKLILGNPKMPDAMAKAYIIYCKFAGITLDVPREYQSYQHKILQSPPSPKLVSYWNKHHPEDLSAHEVKFLTRDLTNRHALDQTGEPIPRPTKGS